MNLIRSGINVSIDGNGLVFVQRRHEYASITIDNYVETVQSDAIFIAHAHISDRHICVTSRKTRVFVEHLAARQHF